MLCLTIDWVHIVVIFWTQFIEKKLKLYKKNVQDGCKTTLIHFDKCLLVLLLQAWFKIL